MARAEKGPVVRTDRVRLTVEGVEVSLAILVGLRLGVPRSPLGVEAVAELFVD